MSKASRAIFLPPEHQVDMRLVGRRNLVIKQRHVGDLRRIGAGGVQRGLERLELAPGGLEHAAMPTPNSSSSDPARALTRPARAGAGTLLQASCTALRARVISQLSAIGAAGSAQKKDFRVRGASVMRQPAGSG
jgi:hypothetical protein